MNIKPECDQPCHECVAFDGCIDHTVDPGNITGKMIECLLELDLWWGRARLGLILCSAYFTNTPMSTDELAERTSYSAETMRKRLKPLINIGRVDVVKEGRNIRYKARSEWAVKTRGMLMRARDEVNANIRDQPPGVSNWVMPRRLVPYELSDNFNDTDTHDLELLTGALAL